MTPEEQKFVDLVSSDIAADLDEALRPKQTPKEWADGHKPGPLRDTSKAPWYDATVDAMKPKPVRFVVEDEAQQTPSMLISIPWDPKLMPTLNPDGSYFIDPATGHVYEQTGISTYYLRGTVN